ncbi:MAG TPA: chemotaxis protein CheW [Stellaceae bacterium]|jgi:purine-binding chemotaxis protein CheW
MSDDGLELLSRAASLREAFDRSFSEPLRTGAVVAEEMLGIRLGAEAYALPLSDIAGLFADRKVVPLPGAGTVQLGIVGFRSEIVPVYDLQVLLGHPSTGSARWLVLAAAAPVAFAFAAQEGRLSIPPEAIVDQSDGLPGGHVRHLVHMSGSVRRVIDLSSVLKAIRREVSATLNLRGVE